MPSIQPVNPGGLKRAPKDDKPKPRKKGPPKPVARKPKKPVTGGGGYTPLV